MKNQKPLFLVLLAITFLTFFFSCSFFNIEQKTSTLSIKLPQIPSSRSITYDADNNIEFTDGKIDKTAIDIYEISIISSNGNIITESVENGTEEVTFSNIQVGTWTVNFNAYALDKDSKKVLVANAKKEVQIIENETTIAELKPNFIKWVFEDINSISITGKEKKPLIDFVNNYENPVPISDLYSFEPTEGQFQFIKISNGYIVPVKPGNEELKIIRRFDKVEIQISSVNIIPEVKLNLFIDGQLKKSIRSSDEGYNLYNNFENFEIPNDINNLLTEGQNASWYFDKNYSQSSKITKYNNLLSLGEKFKSLEVTKNLFTEVNLYTTNETIVNEISSASEFTDAFSNGGTYLIDGNNFPDGISIPSTCSTNKYVKIMFKNNVTIKRVYFKGKMVFVTSRASLIIVPDSTTPNSYLTFDGTIGNDATAKAEDKIMELDSSGNSKFQNVIFTNNKINGSYANASAIMVGGTGENEFINCKVKDNSIGGSYSRAPGIKIEGGAKATFDGMEFSNNVCSETPYGLDIWIDRDSAIVVFKGIIKNDNGISLHYRVVGGSSRYTIDATAVNTTSSDFNITLGKITSDTGIEKPTNSPSIFYFGTNGESLSPKFKTYKLNESNEMEIDTNSSINDAGKFIIIS